MKKTFLLLILALVGFTLFADMARTAAPAPRSIGSLLYQTVWADESESPITVIPCGAPGQPRYQKDRVNAYSTITYYLNFIGGEKAEVRIKGDGDTDLDLYIYDSKGNLIVKDEGWTDSAEVSWTPSKTEQFKIVIKNLGRVYNVFEIWTN